MFCSKGKTFSHYFPIFGKTFKTEVKRYKNTVAKLLLKINSLCGNLIQNSMLWFYSSCPSASPVGVTQKRAKILKIRVLALFFAYAQRWNTHRDHSPAVQTVGRSGCRGYCVFGESNISIAENLFRKMAENGNKSFKMTSLFRKNGIFRNKHHIILNLFAFPRGNRNAK